MSAGELNEHEVVLVSDVTVIAIVALFANNLVLVFHELFHLLRFKLLDSLGKRHA